MQTTPPDWCHRTHALWHKGRRHEAVQAVFAAINASGAKKTKGLMMQAGFYLFLLNDYAAAAQILQHGLELFPKDKDLWRNLVVALSRLGQYEAARQQGEPYVALYPDDAAMWDTLTVVYYRLGLHEQAIMAGTQALALKDTAASACPAAWSLPSGPPRDFCANKQRVISFSLWGEQPRYLYGALRNALLAADIYPGWTLWFYVDSSVPLAFRDLLISLGAKLIMRPATDDIKTKLCWRFAVANAPDVGYFLVRDADSVISIRERKAVDEWLHSGRWFHVIRDWWTHTDLMLAGLWGGVAGVLPALAPMLAQYQANAVETPNIDQWFLRDNIWPYVSTSVLVHDRVFNHGAVQRLPEATPIDDFHVGCCEYSQRRQWQAAWLAPWLAQMPSL